MIINNNLKIGLNATCFDKRPSGAKQRFINLYSKIFDLLPNDKFFIFEPKNYSFKKVFKNKNVYYVKTNIINKGKFLSYFKNNLYWSKNLKNYNLDIFECFHLPFFYNGVFKKILTVHDIRYVYKDFNFYFYKIYKFFFKLNIKFFDHIITVSNAIKKEIEVFHNINTTTIHNGIERYNFSQTNNLKKKKFKKNFKIYNNFILTVGHFEKRKNFLLLIKAFRLLNDPKIKLVIIGNAKTIKEKIYKDRLMNFIKKNQLHDDIKIFSNVDENYLKIFYQKCKLFIFPSLYEGFGIPLLEAMSFKKRILLSDISVFKEICNFEKKCFFDPNNPNEMADSINFYINKKFRKNYNKELRNYCFDFLAKKAIKIYKNL